MLKMARLYNPARPGAPDVLAWTISREWCRAAESACSACPLVCVGASILKLAATPSPELPLAGVEQSEEEPAFDLLLHERTRLFRRRNAIRRW